MYLKRMEDTQWFRKSAVYVSGRKRENQFKQEKYCTDNITDLGN